jgi:hypothetical protein
MMVTPARLRASSLASTSADVLLPQPPLGLAKTIVGMLSYFSAQKPLSDDEQTFAV